MNEDLHASGVGDNNSLSLGGDARCNVSLNGPGAIREEEDAFVDAVIV